MPIYEYTCDKCAAEFEELVFGGDDSDVACPECDGGDVTRKMSTFAFKSGGKFVSSHEPSCDGCTPSPGGCKGCGGH